MPDRAQDTPGGGDIIKLMAIYMAAEMGIIDELARLRSRGLVDYHAVDALARVQETLRRMQTDAAPYFPSMVEAQFTAANAGGVMSTTQVDIVQRLVGAMDNTLNQAAATVMVGLQNAMIGRREQDLLRSLSLDLVSQIQATGKALLPATEKFLDTIRREGITAFVDKAGRRWSLHTYMDMVTRTTSRQAEVLAVLTRDEKHDLYKISSHGSTCPICAPLEGRVYSRSGTDPDFPPLAMAFGKIDKNGPDDLSNTWLNIHPNCLHSLMMWTPAGRTDEEVEEAKRFSSFESNPKTHDPRSQKQIDAYRNKEQGRAKMLADMRQWERYKLTMGDRVPSFQTFQKHKLVGSKRYKMLELGYREANARLKYAPGSGMIDPSSGLQRQLPYTAGGEKGFIPSETAFASTPKSIAGAGSDTPLKQAENLSRIYGGRAGQWSKRVAKIESDKYVFDVHWYELNGNQYEMKLKSRKER